jgi:sugar-phosphatase
MTSNGSIDFYSFRNSMDANPQHESEIVVACSAILFDMDGVLIDSTPAVARVWAGWAREHGFDPADVVRRAHGRPSLTTVMELLPDSDHEAENREVERREIEDLEGVVPIPGAVELLNTLSPDCWALVTSSTRALAETRLRATGLPIPRHFVTSSDVVQGKPHPEPYLKAAEMLGVKAADCIVVEDVPAGIRAGTAAGARVIAFTTTTSAPKLLAAGARWVLKDCTGLAVEASNTHCPLRLTLTRGSLV